MLAQNVGIFIAVMSAVLVSIAVNITWRSTRLAIAGAPMIAGPIAGGAAFALQLLGAGDVRLIAATGAIDWPPVISTVFVGGGTGVLTAAAIGMMRWGGRGQRRRAAAARQAREEARRAPPPADADRADGAGPPA